MHSCPVITIEEDIAFKSCESLPVVIPRKGYPEGTRKNDIIRGLQKEVLALQGFRVPSAGQKIRTGLGPIERAFPNKTFPVGAVHEYLSYNREDAAATNGFVSALLGAFMKGGGNCLWISSRRTIFPPALAFFGLQPERIIFVDAVKEKEALWALEEALKCEALAAVVGELSELSITGSRRLQLAVEQSRVTGFIHRYSPRCESNIACVSRWKIRSLSSVIEDGMPGVGFPCWDVALTKVRNGKPGAWQLEWAEGKFRHLIGRKIPIPDTSIQKTG